MSSRTAIPATASVTTSVGAPLNEIAAIARRRASTLTSDLGTDVLVQRTLQRFDETFGTTSCPLDLDGWVRRAMQEIATAPAPAAFKAFTRTDAKPEPVEHLAHRRRG